MEKANPVPMEEQLHKTPIHTLEMEGLTIMDSHTIVKLEEIEEM